MSIFDCKLPSLADVAGCDCALCMIAQESWQDCHPLGIFDHNVYLDADPDDIFVQVDAGGVTLYGKNIITRYRPMDVLDGFVKDWMKLSAVSDALQ